MPDHRDVDQLLDDMNDVITDWEGSEDAAQWSAERGWTDADYEPDLDALGLVEAAQQAADAMGRVLDALAEWFKTPEFQMFVEFGRQLQAHPGASPQEVNEIRRRVLALARSSKEGNDA